jgi:hypothetical protein
MTEISTRGPGQPGPFFCPVISPVVLLSKNASQASKFDLWLDFMTQGILPYTGRKTFCLTGQLRVFPGLSQEKPDCLSDIVEKA